MSITISSTSGFQNVMTQTFPDGNEWIWAVKASGSNTWYYFGNDATWAQNNQGMQNVYTTGIINTIELVNGTSTSTGTSCVALIITDVSGATFQFNSFTLNSLSGTNTKTNPPNNSATAVLTQFAIIADSGNYASFDLSNCTWQSANTNPPPNGTGGSNTTSQATMLFYVEIFGAVALGCILLYMIYKLL